MTDNPLVAAYREHLNSNYVDFLLRQGLGSTVVEAKGARLRDDQGKEYIDFVAGYGIFNLGHNPGRVIAALRQELATDPLWNRPFLSAPLAELATRLVALAPEGLEQIFVCSTGAEAVESALKLARLATRRSGIVAVEGGFHGFTLGALSVSGIPAQTRPFRPMLPGIRHVPLGDVEALTAAVSEETAAVLLEPIQAEMGALKPPEGYLTAAREVCDRFGALLMIDEVRTGMGRTGPMFAVEHEQVTPDVLITGKSLGGGIVPIGAIMARSRVWKRFGLSFAMSASTFAGNRLACVAALATLNTMATENVLERGRLAAETLWKGLSDLAADYPELVACLTGKGLLVGVHFRDRRFASDVVCQSIREGLLVGNAFCDNRCILIEPPLIIEPGDLRHGLKALRSALRKVRMPRGAE